MSYSEVSSSIIKYGLNRQRSDFSRFEADQERGHRSH